MAVLDPKTANIRYHDAAARDYGAKWSIGFDARCVAYVRERAERMLPGERYGRALEVGAGTGFFLLNLWQAGYVEEAHATDISTGMLAVCADNARTIGCDVLVKPADAEVLPYPDASFDLVVGHAFLHHIPDPRAAIEEIHRVLAPGGALFIAGEPTRAGDRIAELGKRAARVAVRAADRLGWSIRRPPPPEPATEDERILRDLEFDVDLHTFEPREVAAWLGHAGFRSVRIETEELTASLVGWAVRTIESEVRPEVLPPWWGRVAYDVWRGLSLLDALLARVIPARLFYNLLLYAEKEGSPP